MKPFSEGDWIPGESDIAAVTTLPLHYGENRCLPLFAPIHLPLGVSIILPVISPDLH